MKRALLILPAIIFSLTLQAQVSITLSVDPNPNPMFDDWVNRDELAIMTITNSNPQLEGMEYKIRLRMSIDNQLVAETNLAQIPARVLPLGTEVFLADEIIPFNAMNFYGNLVNQVTLTGMLPAGLYSFCVSLVDMNNNTISSPMEACRPMVVTSFQQPELIFPVDDIELDANNVQATEFIWSPMTPSPPAEMGLKYVLVISELYPAQTASQALMINYPLIEEEIIGNNRMLWPFELDVPTEHTNYVWSVKAVTTDDQPYHPENNGFASYGTFSVNPQNVFEEEEEEETPPVEEGELAVTDTIFAGENGEFNVIVSEINLENNKYTGKGSVYIGWLNAHIDVKFDTITVDTTKHLLSGKVLAEIHENAPIYPLAWALQATSPPPTTHNTVVDIATFVENNSEQTIFFNNPTEVTEPVQMPLGMIFPDGAEFAITEMAFLTDKSKFNAITAMPLPPNMVTERIGFRIKEVRFHPNEFESPPGRIEIVEDISTTNINQKIEFVFKKPDENNLGCYIEFDEDGFKEYGLQINTLFTRDWMLPVPDEGERVTTTVSAQGTSWNDLILGGTMSKFELPDGHGMTFLVDSLFFDMSDVLNPPGIVFPENYPGDSTITFNGFYMNAFEIELPEKLETMEGQKPKVSAYNVIINNTGITLLAEASNVVQFPAGSVADLNASIDTVHFEWIASSMVEAGINGKIGLPFSKIDSLNNPLQYSALFSNPVYTNEPQSLQVSITPTGPIPAHLLKADIDLAATSNMVAYFDNDKKTFDLTLNGSLNWANVKLGPIKNVELGLDFEGMGMNYDSSQDEQQQFGFNVGTWAFASPQKYLADFPITIEEIGFDNLPKQQGQLMHGKINFDVIFNLSSDIGGMTGLGVEMAILNNDQNQKFYPQYISTGIDSIAIQANMAAVSIDGALGFREDDPVYGNGFIGFLNADFKPAGVKVEALGEFGNTTYQNGNQLYRYWRVDANATLAAPGLTFLPGFAFRGFGGGAYNNMEASLSGTTYTFSPKKSSLGLQVKAAMATTPKEDGFNTDVILAGEFNQNTGGLTFINFTGDFWMGADMTTASRNNAMVNGAIGATYDFPEKHFNFFANVNVNAPPVSTPSPMSLVVDVKGKENEWYVKFGDAQVPNTVLVSMAGLNATVDNYLMFGNKIEAPDGFSSQFSNSYYYATQSWPSNNLGNGGIGSHTATGSGFATGIGFRFAYEDQRHLKGNYYLGFDLGAGAELHLAFMEYLGACGGFSPMGINGWRASGMLGFYGFASAEVRRRNGLLPDNEWTLAHIGAGAWVSGQFPNPYYLSGALSGYVNILDVVESSFNYSFQAGTPCNNQGAGVMTVEQGDAAADQQEQLIQYVAPASVYNYPVDAPLAVKFGLEPEEVFDVSEQQDDGTVIMRTFKLEVTRSLQIQNEDESWSSVMLNTNVNNLGEYLYTTIQMLDQGNAPALNFGGSGGGGTTTTGNTTINTNAVSFNNWITGGGFTTTTGSVGTAAQPNSSISNGGSTVGGSASTPSAFDQANFPSIQVPNPPPPPTPDYGDDLETEPNLPQNSLKEDKNYKFTVTATLKEYKNNNWVNAQTLNGNSVTQTVEKEFFTGPIPMVTNAQQNLQTF